MNESVVQFSYDSRMDKCWWDDGQIVIECDHGKLLYFRVDIWWKHVSLRSIFNAKKIGMGQRERNGEKLTSINYYWLENKSKVKVWLEAKSFCRLKFGFTTLAYTLENGGDKN